MKKILYYGLLLILCFRFDPQQSRTFAELTSKPQPKKKQMPRGRSSSPTRSSAPTKTKTQDARHNAPAPARSAPQAPPQAPPQQAPSNPMMQQQPQGGGMMSGIVGGIVQGMAFGTGSAIANRAVDSVMGPRQMEVVHKDGPSQPQGNNNRCNSEDSQFQKCMNDNRNDFSSCSFYYDVLSQCKKQNA